jgi:hypothetical protein
VYQIFNMELSVYGARASRQKMASDSLTVLLKILVTHSIINAASGHPLEQVSFACSGLVWR